VPPTNTAPPYDVRRTLHAGGPMDVAALTEAVAALERADAGSVHPLADEEFVAALMRVIPADEVSLNDLHPRDGTDETLTIVNSPDVLDEPFEQFWFHFWDSAPCSYTEQRPDLRRTPMATSDFYGEREWHSKSMYVEVLHPAGLECELVVPLPAPDHSSRRLLLARTERRPFSSDDCRAARLLRPHIVDALRDYERCCAAEGLTERQREIVAMLTAGMDNVAIARRLRVSPGTVRKHVENVFARLDVRTRGEAVVKTHPDLVWTD